MCPDAFSVSLELKDTHFMHDLAIFVKETAAVVGFVCLVAPLVVEKKSINFMCQGCCI